jgi:PAS domain S-box-containing protein
MLGSLEEMLRQPPEEIGEENAESLRTSHRNALRLLRLVNNLLEFSRIEAGRAEARFQRTNIVKFTDDIAAGFRSLIVQSGMKFALKSNDINEAVYVDRSMWEKIVLNLISNAFRYTLKGSITVSILKKGDHVQLSVADTGIGIPEKDLPKMFERFHRVENNTGRTHEGTGIGLSLVAELVKLHHGTIAVESKIGKGSTFTVSIPVGKEHLPADRITESDTDFHSTLSDAFVTEAEALTDNIISERNGIGSKDEVLVVDDNADMRRYFQKLLERDFEVITASNGKEALEKMAEFIPEIVVSDVMMPVMDGIELLKEIKNNAYTANVPVILVSARAGEEATSEGLDMGADDYLVKPFSSRELLSRVKSQIKISKTHKEFSDKLERLVAERTEELRSKNNDLENAHSFLQQVIDSSVEYISVFDTDLHYVTVNERYEEVIGLKKKDIYGKHLLEVNPTAAETQQFENIKRALKGETSYLTKRNAIARPELFVDTYFVPLVLQNEIRGVIVLARDVTEIVLSEQLLRVKNMELERSNDDLQQFAHVASHDLKEPVRKVRMFGSRIRDEYKDILPERAMSYLKKMDDAANRMYEMIEGVLRYSSLNAVQQTAEEIDLNKIFEEIKSDLELLITSREAVVNHAVLPTIKGSRILIYQLFYNLLNNSLKFSKTTVQPLVNIAAKILSGKDVPVQDAKPEVKYHEIIVSDNGIGFNQRDAEKIFQSFSRLNAKDKYEGTGLGLALCKKIVERHNGFITAIGQEGEGAAFMIYLPA